MVLSFETRVPWVVMKGIYGRYSGKYARLRKCPGKEQVEYHSMSFTQRRNYSRGIGHVWGPSKIKGGRETGSSCRKPEKTKRHVHFPLIPTRAFESSVDDSKRNMEETGDEYERSGNSQRGPGWATFPHRRNYSRHIGDVWVWDQKIKGGQLLLYYKYWTSLETGNICRKPMKSKHFLCPPIPTRTLESSLDDSEENMEEIS